MARLTTKSLFTLSAIAELRIFSALRIRDQVEIAVPDWNKNINVQKELYCTNKSIRFELFTLYTKYLTPWCHEAKGQLCTRLHNSAKINCSGPRFNGVLLLSYQLFQEEIYRMVSAEDCPSYQLNGVKGMVTRKQKTILFVSIIHILLFDKIYMTPLFGKNSPKYPVFYDNTLLE